jgi:hypothetical protein
LDAAQSLFESIVFVNPQFRFVNRICLDKDIILPAIVAITEHRDTGHNIATDVCYYKRDLPGKDIDGSDRFFH